MSGDRSSMLRKRALRRLSHEQYAAYSALYEQVLSEIPGLTRHHARPRAWTRLRYQFPDRYLELFTLEQSGAGTEVPPDVRSKSWQRANARLADLRKAAYQPRYAKFRARGMASSKAYDRAVAVVREGNADLFARLLAEEYQLWLTASGAAAQAGDRGSAGGCERVETATAAAATTCDASAPAASRKGMAGESQRGQHGRPSSWRLCGHLLVSRPPGAGRDLAGSGRTSKGVRVLDIEALARVLSALAHNDGEPGQRAWAALAGMTTRICGRYSKEGRAVEAVCAAGEPDRAVSAGLARLLIHRARSDARFASGFVPWLAAAQMLLPDVPGER